MTDINETLIGILALGVMVVYKLIDLMGQRGLEWYDKRTGNGQHGAIRSVKESVDALRMEMRESAPPFPACHYDSKHFERIKNIEADVIYIKSVQEEQRRMIDQGRFHCRLKDQHLKSLEDL